MFGEPLAFGFGALVAPDERGTDNRIGDVEKYRAVHLSRQSNALDVADRARRVGKRCTHGRLARAPPIIGRLLGPPGLG